MPDPDHISNPFSIEAYPLQVRHGELEVDFKNKNITMCGYPLPLSRKQREYYAFLSLYLRREKGFVRPEQIFADMIAYDENFHEETKQNLEIARRAVRALINQMKEAMVKSGNYTDLEEAEREIESCYIHCKRGKGYKLLQSN